MYSASLLSEQFISLGFDAVASVIQLFYGDSSQIHVSYAMFFN